MYDYTLIFRLADGGKYITADFGFDSKTGKTIYKITGSSEPLDLDTFQEFVSYMKSIETLKLKYGGVPIIMTKSIAYIDPNYDIKKKNVV